jgi:hypothetical protein
MEERLLELRCGHQGATIKSTLGKEYFGIKYWINASGSLMHLDFKNTTSNKAGEETI